MIFKNANQRINLTTALILSLSQLVCLAGFLYFMSFGKNNFAWLILLIPFQFIIWILLFQNNQLLLLAAAIMAPIAICQLIPNDYQQFLFFPSVIFFLLVLKFTPWLDDYLDAKSGNLPVAEKISSVLLLSWIILSFIFAIIRGPVYHFFVTCNILILEVFIIGYFFAIIPQNQNEIKRLILAITIGVVICVLSLPFLVKYSAGFVDTFGGKKLSGPFGILDLNALGLLIATLAAALLGILIGEQQFKRRLLLSIIILILFAGLVFTRSRGAWFGFGMAVLYLLIKSRSAILAALTGAGGLFLLLSSFLRSLFISRVESTSFADPAFVARLILWNFGLLVARKNWLLGVGWENFRFLKYYYGYPRLFDPKVYFSTHNLYIETMADLGFIGFLLFVILLFGTIVRTNRLISQNCSEYQHIALGVTAALIAFAAHSAFDSLSSTFMVIGMWFGLAMALQRLASKSRVSSLENDLFG
jgi:O-antigen ligase